MAIILYGTQWTSKLNLGGVVKLCFIWAIQSLV